MIEKENFRQADSIEVAIHIVSVALRDGGVLVVVILFLFLGNLRTTFISAVAIPLSLIAGVVVIFEGTLNTMTLGGALLALAGAFALPPFNEGSLTVALVSPLGTTLADGDEVGRQVEKVVLAFPEVVSTSRRTGRAEEDEHVQGVTASEMEVVLRPGRPKPELAEMRRAVATIPGVSVSCGQAISQPH